MSLEKPYTEISSTGTGILDVDVVSAWGHTPNCPPGYDRIPVNLKRSTGSGTPDIYLCKKTGTGTTGLTHLGMVYGDDSTDVPCPSGTTKIDVELNRGTGSGTPDIYYCKTLGKPPFIQDVNVVNQGHDLEFKYSKYRPWDPVTDPGGTPINANKGTGTGTDNIYSIYLPYHPPPIEPVLVPMQNVLKPMENVLKPLQDLTPPMENVLKPMQNVLKPLQDLTPPMQNVLKPLEPVLKPLQDLTPPMQNVLKPMKDLVAPPIETVLKPMKPVLQPLTNLAAPFYTVITPYHHLLKPFTDLVAPNDQYTSYTTLLCSSSSLCFSFICSILLIILIVMYMS